MKVFGIVLLVLGGLAVLGLSAFLIKEMRGWIRNAMIRKADKKDTIRFLTLSGGIGVAFLLLTLGIFLANPAWRNVTAWGPGAYEGEAIHYGVSLTLALLGALVFGASFSAFWGLYAIFFKKENIDEKQRILVRNLVLILIPVGLLSLICWSEGLAPYFSYPIPNAVGFLDGKFALLTTATVNYATFKIAWYALCILFGVMVCRWMTNYRFYKRYGKKNMADSTAIIGFLFGIIGTRVWYVVGNWEREFAGGPFWQVFAIWNGGLTVLGGVVFGFVAGYIHMRLKYKEVDMRWAIDAIIPTILLAQACGRWGNFFNVEVYGSEVAMSGIWRLLPHWIGQQMAFQSGGALLASHMINVPMFLIEGLVNMAGYFIIWYGVRLGLKKIIRPGDLAGCYFIWYGVVRFIMEPFRNSDFNMGMDNSWSVINALGYIVIGALMILCFHLNDAYKANEGKPHRFLILAVPAVTLSIGALLFAMLLPGLTEAETLGEEVLSVKSYGGSQLIYAGTSVYYSIAYSVAIVAALGAFASLIFALLKKEKIAGYCLFGSGALALVSGFLFLLGKKHTSFYDETYSYSNSYGFALAAYFLFGVAVIAVAFGINIYLKKKAEKIAAEGEKQ